MHRDVMVYTLTTEEGVRLGASYDSFRGAVKDGWLGLTKLGVFPRTIFQRYRLLMREQWSEPASFKIKALHKDGEEYVYFYLAVIPQTELMEGS